MRRSLYIIIFLFSLNAIVGGLPHRASAQEIGPNQVQVYVQNDSLKADVDIDSVFTQEHIDAIESGMTASITVQLRLLRSRNTRIVETEINKQLEHDIWEGKYRLVTFTTPPDTLITESFEEVSRFCTDIQNVSLAPMPLPDEMLILQARVHIDPITPEQQERTRRWLKILRKGSLLEFFFSFRKPNPPTPWVNLMQFRPSALPYLIQEPTQ